MYEKELIAIQKKITEAVKDSAGNMEAAVTKLMSLPKEVAGFAEDTSPEYYNVSSTVFEAIGDIYRKAKKMAEAEKAYLEMVKLAGKLRELDPEKYDYRLGFSYYKRANFYRDLLQCAALNPKPVVLNEQQKKLFNVTEALYKSAVACTMNSAKKGIFRYIELHALCLSELAVFYGAVGNYENAIGCGKDAVRLDKAIYEKLDDKEHSFRLANRMNALATVYAFSKNVQSAMETLEDSNFVLEEHEAEDPVTFGVMLARNYLTLAGCYAKLEEEKENADGTYKTGLQRIEDVNRKTDNRLINDVITGYMIVGDHYKRTKRDMEAKAHYLYARKLASEMFEKTKDLKYENIMKRLEAHI